MLYQDVTKQWNFIDIVKKDCKDAYSIQKMMLLVVLDYVFKLYCKTKAPESINTLSELRQQMFSKKKADSDILPPLFVAMEQNVLQAHYIFLINKSSHISSPVLLNSSYYGWLFNDHYAVYEPIMTCW